MKKKSWRRRWLPDGSQRWRNAVQSGFLLLNLWLGIEIVLFVRHFEGNGPYWPRPAGVEGWLPIAGMMNASYWLQTGYVPGVHPAAMVLFLTFLALSLFFRKAFCGWLCPIGTISEFLWKLGRDTFRHNFFPPRFLDIPLRGLKYILLGLFLWFAAAMPAAAIQDFMHSPYGLIADVKMLGFFRHMSITSAIVIATLVLGSCFVPNLWCRYLCPYGALMGLAALASPLRIRRTPEACIDCAKCAKACPSNLPVDKLIQIRSAECLGCMECVAVCPSENALAMTANATKEISPRWIATGVLAVFCGAVGLAMLTGHWQSHIPERLYRELIPVANGLWHP
jgi:polyferredoxin